MYQNKRIHKMKAIELEELLEEVKILKNKTLELEHSLEQDKKDVENIGKAIEEIKIELASLNR